MDTIYIGTVGTGKAGASVSGNGLGVYTARLEGSDLSLTGVAEAENAGIVCASPDGRFVYAANETRDFGGLPGSGGGVTAFRAGEDGTLEKINDSLSYGSRPSNVAVSEDGRFLLVSNHGSHSAVVCRYAQGTDGTWQLDRGFDDASVACFALREDGGIGELCDLQVFRGSGYWDLGGGQSTAHVHCVRVGSGGLAYACDRGSDVVAVMRLEDDGRLTMLDRHHAPTGYAPRHAAVDDQRGVLYVCNENYPAVSAYRVDRGSGMLEELQTTSTMPESYQAERPLPRFDRDHCEPEERNTCCIFDAETAGPADVHLSHDGRFLYVSNRFLRQGRGSIACFQVLEDATLALRGVWELPGRDPRGFATSPYDNRLMVGLLDLGRVVLLETDPETGMVTRELSSLDCPSPASFVWMAG